MYLVIGIVLAFIVSFWKDNRSLWNPVLFLLSLISSYISLSHLFYKNGYENGHCTHKVRHKKTLLLKSGKLETGVFCYG